MVEKIKKGEVYEVKIMKVISLFKFILAILIKNLIRLNYFSYEILNLCLNYLNSINYFLDNPEIIVTLSVPFFLVN